MVTIYDIAKKMGVSPSTVSRALRNAPGTSAELREKIQRISEEMGYRTNWVARHLRMRNSILVGVIVDEEWNWYSGTVAEGIQSYAYENDIRLLYWNAKSVEDQRMGLEIFEQMRVTGVLFASTQITEAYKGFAKLSCPAVYVNRMMGSKTSRILTDDTRGAALAVRHLLSLGHRDIAFINGPQHSIHSMKRLIGVKDTLKEAGLELPEKWYANVEWTGEQAHEVALDMLSHSRRPTAVICGNDEIAVGVYDAARQLSLDIPKDLSVIGYNDHTCCQYLRPKLTTITLPLWQMGRNALEALHLKIRQKQLPKEKRVVPGELVIRDSTAPCLK